MFDLKELYQEVIVDHNRNPRNFGELDSNVCQCKDGFNPLCGDKLTLYLQVEDDTIIDARFKGKGCAISTASASLMTDALKGLSVSEAKALFDRFHQMVTDSDSTIPENIDKLAVLAGVKAYPARVKCATLAWHTLMAILEGQSTQSVSTE
jgi:nitrogen fixation NifU-like protein